MRENKTREHGFSCSAISGFVSRGAASSNLLEEMLHVIFLLYAFET